jgi:glycosyltransferase involved in cell wall biosynthesis
MSKRAASPLAMKRLRIGYDVSFLAPPAGKRERVTGVGRIIKDLLSALNERDDVEICVTGSFSGDWNCANTSLRAEKWTASQKGVKPLNFMPSFRSRTGLGRLLAQFIFRMEERINHEDKEAPGAAVMAISRVFRKLASLDTEPYLSPHGMDIFHATFMPPPSRGLARFVPRVLTIHDVIPGRFPDECGPHALGQLRSTVDALDHARDVVVANSEFTRKDFCGYAGFPKERTMVAPLAIARHFHRVENEATIRSTCERLDIGRRPYFLSVANPQPRKNLPHLVRSFCEFLTVCPEWDGNLVMVGDVRSGWGMKALEEAIDAAPQFACRIKQLGAVADDDLPALYSGALAFCFPSTYEGFGLPVLEAMACGTAVITSNASSLPEVAGDAALLVGAKDQAALVRAMQALAKNDSLRRDLREKGLQRARQFSWQQTADRVVEAYQFARWGHDRKTFKTGTKILAGVQ